MARRVADYLHARILENPDPYQTYRHEDVGKPLGIDPRKVRLSLAHSGTWWISVEVSKKNRAAISTLIRTQAKDRAKSSKTKAGVLTKKAAIIDD